MATLWQKSWTDYKSPLRVVVQFLLRSRDGWIRKGNELKLELRETERKLAQYEFADKRQSQEIRRLKGQIRRLEVEKQQATCRLSPDLPIGSHGYGERMVCLAVELAKTVGLRPASRVLKLMFYWLDVKQKVPHPTAIRNWLQRVGVAAIKEPIEEAVDWVWMVDHSNQIGPEKALVVLGVRASKLPPPGIALKHEDVRVLTVRPGIHWKREDMATVYEELADKFGTPRAVLMDGAVELRDGAERLKTRRSDTIVLHDFKHKAANLFKATLGKGDRFAEFASKMGRTRSAIQQTELAHLTPPREKPKARFMNLKATLRWAASILWLLENPEAESREWMTSERLEDKLGWLRSFADDLAVWRECEEVIEKGVTFINQQGLFRGAADQLRGLVRLNMSHAKSRQLAAKLIEFVSAAESQLKEGERLPMSTEILESSFALYKQLERQHSKGGFTSLLASFGALLKPQTPETIHRALSMVSVRDVRQWVKTNLGTTLTSRRRATYSEFKSNTKSATTMNSTV